MIRTFLNDLRDATSHFALFLLCTVRDNLIVLKYFLPVLAWFVLVLVAAAAAVPAVLLALPLRLWMGRAVGLRGYAVAGRFHIPAAIAAWRKSKKEEEFWDVWNDACENRQRLSPRTVPAEVVEDSPALNSIPPSESTYYGD